MAHLPKVSFQICIRLAQSVTAVTPCRRHGKDSITSACRRQSAAAAARPDERGETEQTFSLLDKEQHNRDSVTCPQPDFVGK